MDLVTLVISIIVKCDEFNDKMCIPSLLGSSAPFPLCKNWPKSSAPYLTVSTLNSDSEVLGMCTILFLGTNIEEISIFSLRLNVKLKLRISDFDEMD